MIYLVYSLDPAGREISDSLRIFNDERSVTKYTSNGDFHVHKELGRRLPDLSADTSARTIP